MLANNVQMWNSLRKRDPRFIPYLRSANFEGRDFNGADLHKANLRGAYLNATKLVGADRAR